MLAVYIAVMFSTYIAHNRQIPQDSKIGYFAVLGVLIFIKFILGILLS